MSKFIARLLSLLLLLYTGSAHAQQPDRPPHLNLGDAVVTGFSGAVTPDPGQRRPANKSAIDLTFINPDGASVRVIDVARPGHVWDGRLFPAQKKFDVPAKEVGQVFGIVLDDQPVPNIYVAATSVFGLHIVNRGRDGLPERRKKGGPGAGWMKGQFGLDLQGGPGAIYKIDGRTGAVSLFANVTLEGVPNPGPGLGNLAYDSANKQLFVSDLYTGMIHRFDLDGRELGSFDHGVTGLGAAKLPAVLFSPRNRPNIANDRFDTERPETWGFAAPARRVWGLAVHQGRLYYSVVAGPQIWSVGIDRDGGFAADPRWELDVPAQAGPLPVSDIAFSQRGAMILAQRALIAGAYDYSAFTRPGEPQVFRIWLKGPNDPVSPGRWKPVPEEYAVGFAGNHRNTNGGVALGYGYGQDGAMSANACEFSLWTTAQNMRNAPTLRDRLDPGGPLVVHGIQGLPASPVRDVNVPPWTSYSVGYADKTDDPRAAGHLGSVRIYSKPCVAPAVYSGPGYPASPPYTSPPPIVVVDTGCVGRDCPPPPPRPDLEIRKIGEHNPNNPNGPYNFTIGVRNLGIALTGPQTITVTDVVPAGMTFTSVTPTNWTCAPLPVIPSGGTLTCTYTGTFPVATSQLLGTIGIVATGGAGPHENCASLSVPNDGNSSNDRACITVQKPPLDVKLEKKMSGILGPHFMFDIDVSNVGTAFINGSFTVTDAVPSGMTVMSTTGGWTCNAPVTGPNPLMCTLPEASIPLNAALPTIKLTTFTTGLGPWENCAVVSVVTTSGTDTNPANDKACASAVKEQVGEIIVEKKVVYTGELVMPSLTYPVAVTCGTWSQTFNLVPNVPQSAGGVPLNVNCAVVETLPPAPASACPAPKVATWQTPVVVPATPFQLSGVSTSVTVTNTLDCKDGDGGNNGYVLVKKEVVSHGMGFAAPPMTFPVNVTCSGVTTTLNLSSNGTPQMVGGLAIGTSCQVNEPASNNNACPTNMTTVWGTTTYSPSSTASAAMPGPTVTVTNPFSCVPGGGGTGGQLEVKKLVVNTDPIRLTYNGTFNINVSCQLGTSPAVLNTVTLAGGGSQTISNIALNSLCKATEATPLPVPTGNCLIAGQVPTWTIDYLPQDTATIGNTLSTITVRNTLECKDGSDGLGKLVLTKVVNNPYKAFLSTNNLTYPTTVTCSSGMSPGVVTNVGLTESGSQTVSNIALNSLCSIVEMPPTVTGFCPTAGHVPTWSMPPSISPASPVPVNGTTVNVTVTNTLECKPSTQTSQLLVQKVVDNTKGGLVPLPAQTFPVTVTCGGNAQTVNVAANTTLAVGAVPYGICTVNEPTPPVLPGSCPAGSTGSWTSVYQTSITVNQPTVVVNVTNTLVCTPSFVTGYMRVVKTIDAGNTTNTMAALDSLVFPVTVTCNGVATSLNVQRTVPGVVSGIPAPATCIVAEGTPPVVTTGCPAGQSPVWSTPPTYLPANATVNISSGMGPVVTIRNTLSCAPTINNQTGSLTVTKTVTSSGGLPTAGLSFPASVSCSSGMSPAVVTPLTALSHGSTQTISVALGSTCTVTETLPTPTGACADQTKVPTWTTTSTPPTASIPTNTSIAVLNSLDCKDPGGQGGGGNGGGSSGIGSLVVTKNVVNNTTGTVANTSYAVTVSCQLGSGSPVITPLTLVHGVPQTVPAISLGSNCTVTETETLLLPPGNVCAGTGPNRPYPAWMTTVTPSPVPVNGLNTPVTVLNSLDCIPTTGNNARGHVIIRKVIQNDTSANLSSMTFPVTVTCGNTAGTLTLTPSILSQTMFSIPVGTACSAVEALPPPPTSGCDQGQVPAWVNSPSYSNASVTIVAGAGPTITVTNKLVCQAQAQLSPPQSPPPPPPRPTACVAPMVPGAIPGQCACPGGTVQSGKECVKQTACKAPMVAGAVPGQCNCPSGTTKRGARCVTTLVCRSPAKLNSKGTACSCPQGMTLKGNTCVERERQGPTISPTDVIRVIPGLLGGGGGGRQRPDGGGGGGGGGGAKPDGPRGVR